MKKLYKAISLPLCLLLVLSFAGCSSKMPVNADDFKTVMTEKDYQVEDVTEDFAEYEYISCALIAKTADENYEIKFYQTDTADSAHRLFESNQADYDENEDSIYSRSLVNSPNHSKYTLSGAGKLVVISRIENTIVFVKCSSAYKNEVKAVIEELGY